MEALHDVSLFTVTLFAMYESWIVTGYRWWNKVGWDGMAVLQPLRLIQAPNTNLPMLSVYPPPHDARATAAPFPPLD